MGLDMYLRARRYVSGWERINTPEESNEWEHLVDFYDMRSFIPDGSPHAYVEFCVAYWRKAHSVHEWFVKNIQDGEDECESFLVEREQLEELRTSCLRQLADMEGVGEDDDNEEGWLFYQLKSTVTQIDKVLKLGSGWDFVYQSSW